MTLNDVLLDVQQRPSTNGTRILGVDGPSGSGKSTLARRLAAYSNATLVELDDFVAWKNFAGWWPRFDSEVLHPLLQGRDARYQVRDWENDEFGESLSSWKTARWSPFIIVEGVTSTRQQADGRLAYSIWVEAPEPLRLERGVARDGETHRQLWLDWMREETAFFAADGTRDRADLRVDGAPKAEHDVESEVALADER